MAITTHLYRATAEQAKRTSALGVDFGLHDPTPARDYHEFVGEGLRGLCNASARARGEKPDPALPSAIRRELEVARAQGSTDFTDVLANVAGKQLLLGYNDASTAYAHICRPGSVPNFKTASRVTLSEFDLAKTPESGEILAVARTDRAESVGIDTYSARFEVTYEALLGDDPGAFARSARDAGRAAAGKKDSVFIDALTSASGAGPTMGEDAVALFNVATHGNYVATSGAAPSVTTLGAAFAAMRTRTDPQTGRALNIPPRILLVPAALEPTARILAASWNSALADREGDIIVVASGLLDAKSTTRWYLFADPLKFDVWEVAGLHGEHEPNLSLWAPLRVEGLAVKITCDFGFAPLDWRTQYANVGA